MKKLNFIILIFILAVSFTSCSSDDGPKDEPKGKYEEGFFITNEGLFNSGSGTITFVGEDGTVEQEVYKKVNNDVLGNVVQSMVMAGDNAYIIVNNSHKIVVVNRYTFKKEAVIGGDDILNPRQMVIHNGVGYVSNWGDPLKSDDDFIAMIDLGTNKVTGKISVGEGPEDMLVYADRLFVNLQGGWSQNNKVALINLNTNQLEKNIEVRDVPNSIVEDNKGNIWVLCGGKPAWTQDESNGSLVRINPTGSEVVAYDFGDGDHPNHLTIDHDNLLYNLNGSVYIASVLNAGIPKPIDGITGFFYNMIARNGELYTLDAKDYSSEGELKIFNIANGTLLASIQTGIIPGSVAFQE